MKGKVALITGAGKGIGKATALYFGKLGVHTALVSRTNSELEQTRKEVLAISPSGTDCFCYTTDLSSEKNAVEAFANSLKKFGQIDFLINNAGAVVALSVLEQTRSAWDQVMGINILAPMILSREFFKHRKEKGPGGVIINISSLAGIRGTDKFPGFSSYVASKFAIIGLTESLAVEGAPLGVRANCIAPGAVDTEMLRKAVPHLNPKAKPEDIAKLIAFLCDSTQSGILTGSTLEVFSNA